MRLLVVRRLCAFLIDQSVLCGFFFFTSLIGIFSSWLIIRVPMIGLVFCFYVGLVQLLYYSFFESSLWQATPGKRVFGLVVVSREHKKISFLRACIRHLLYNLSLFGMWLTIFWTKEKQTLYDLMTKTIVTDKLGATARAWHKDSLSKD